MTRVLTFVAIVALMGVVRFLGTDGLVAAQSQVTVAFGFLLLAAYLIGEIFSTVSLPKISGYIFTGLLFGPHILDFVEIEMVQRLKVVDDLALTFIALAAGGELRVKDLRSRYRSILYTIFFLTTVVWSGVTLFVLSTHGLVPFTREMGFPVLFSVALLFGVISVARSPSSAIAIIKECRARGPFTEGVLGVTVAMDVVIILLFAATVSVAGVLSQSDGSFHAGLLLVLSAEILLSLSLGYLVGLFMAFYIKRIRVYLAVFVLGITFSIARFSYYLGAFMEESFHVAFHLEPLLICMAAGFIIQNRSSEGERLMNAIDRSSLPVYVIFFALTGAALDLDALRQTWHVAISLAGVRLVMIWLGAFLGGRLSGDPPTFYRNSWLAFVTQAGVSLGLAAIVARRFPQWGVSFATIVVAVIAVNQLIGPVAFKLALARVGETRAGRRRPLPSI
ncbi:MAG: cation:proton antiporter [Deltaproteobacteria bacterium]|nr:cation:proton antiporter [Deltaproteobacteria bacterium]